MYLIFWLAFLSLWAVLIRQGMRVRVAFMAAHVVNGVLIVLVTETLSAFQALTLWPLVTFWSVVLGVNLVGWYRLRNRPLAENAFVPLAALEVIILVAIGIIVAVTGITALAAPPNSFDSQVYHMSRVAHWAFNATVANYPTYAIRQLVYPPYGEFAILQTYVMSGADHFANLVQWNSMVASLIGVSLIAEMLGGSRRAQICAVLFAVTVPMGVLQSSSTQNDYVATQWAVCVAVFTMLLIMTGKRRWGILGAASFGLAVFTKGTVVFLGMPFVIWALWRVQWKVGHKIGLCLFGILTVLLINAAFLHRLTALAPNPYKAMAMGAEEAGEAAVLVDSVDVRGMVSNLVRGVATELDGPFPAWNRWLFKSVVSVHRWLGISITDPRFTFASFDFLLWDAVPVFEDFMTSWVHAIVYIMVVIYIIMVALHRIHLGVTRRSALALDAVPGGQKNQWEQRELFWYFVAIFLVAVFLFCALVKWQPWIARFHLPFFVMFSAVAGVVLDGFSPRPRLSLPVGAIMFTFAILPLLQNPQRPVLPCGAVTRSSLAMSVPHGDEIFGWLMKNGYFKEKSGDTGYLGDITEDMRGRLKQVYPEAYASVWSVLSEETISFDRGLFFTPREELLFGRFSKMSRDVVIYNIQFMRQQLRMSPGCHDVGFVKGPIEYPFWSLLNSDGRAVRIEHILVDNASRRIPYPRGEPEPCLILQEGNDGPMTITYHGRIYLRATPGPVQVYVDSQTAPSGRRGNPFANP